MFSTTKSSLWFVRKGGKGVEIRKKSWGAQLDCLGRAIFDHNDYKVWDKKVMMNRTTWSEVDSLKYSEKFTR